MGVHLKLQSKYWSDDSFQSNRHKEPSKLNSPHSLCRSHSLDKGRCLVSWMKTLVHSSGHWCKITDFSWWNRSHEQFNHPERNISERVHQELLWSLPLTLKAGHSERSGSDKMIKIWAVNNKSSALQASLQVLTLKILVYDFCLFPLKGFQPHY